MFGTIVVGVVDGSHNTLYISLFSLRVAPQIGEVGKMGEPTCEACNTFIDVFGSRLLMLLDDIGQFFLWVVAAALDRRKIGFDWLGLV